MKNHMRTCVKNMFEIVQFETLILILREYVIIIFLLKYFFHIFSETNKTHVTWKFVFIKSLDAE